MNSQMNPAETIELLKKLAKSASWWRRFFESTDAEEIHQIISGLPPLELAALDQRVRESWMAYRFYDLNNWQSLRPLDVNRLAESKFATSLLGLASSHSSGYVRETAVRALAAQTSGKELSFLLIRLNDWVAQVRAAAEVAVRERISTGYALHFLANISLVLRLRACGRVDRKFVDDICGLLKLPECKEVLRTGMSSDDRVVRRISYQLAAESEPSTRSAIVQALMADPDAVARSWAVRHFLPDVAPDELPTLVLPMLDDKFMPIRRDALWTVATKRPDLAAEPLRRAMLDSHVSMREVARQFLPLANIANARSFYIEALERGAVAHRFAAICGLGETGNASDASRLANFLDSPLPKMRRAAVFAVGRLDVECYMARLVSILWDEKASVSREAMKALLPKARQIPLDDLEQLINSVPSFHARRNALTLVLHMSKWHKLPLLLHACADKDAKLAEMAARALQNWFSNYNQSFVEPTRSDFDKVRSALSKVESKLPHRLAKELRNCLTPYFG